MVTSGHVTKMAVKRQTSNVMAVHVRLIHCVSKHSPHYCDDDFVQS